MGILKTPLPFMETSKLQTWERRLILPIPSQHPTSKCSVSPANLLLWVWIHCLLFQLPCPSLGVTGHTKEVLDFSLNTLTMGLAKPEPTSVLSPHLPGAGTLRFFSQWLPMAPRLSSMGDPQPCVPRLLCIPLPTPHSGSHLALKGTLLTSTHVFSHVRPPLEIILPPCLLLACSLYGLTMVTIWDMSLTNKIGFSCPK